MNKVKIVVAVLLLSACSAQTVPTAPPLSPADECRQAQQSGDTLAVSQKCGAIIRDQ
ncbi:hypothetical protein [Enterobacter sp. ENT03]|uniref:hypothetical protein n=1 Tax=Enterobacter sp. ENT03 TaxID=2854780 RepID=UPI001C456DE2|nr:hypothetical protein [Enterobacter sp. ENT03]MBV7405144.1 hypothetical protein [Enterobacter sp. ENT03]